MASCLFLTGKRLYSLQCLILPLTRIDKGACRLYGLHLRYSRENEQR